MRRKKMTPELSRMKENLCEIGNNIRDYKKKITDFQKELSWAKNPETKREVHKLLKECMQKIVILSPDYRHMHIAYSELRGQTRSGIEKNVRETTPKLSEKIIADYKEEYGR